MSSRSRVPRSSEQRGGVVALQQPMASGDELERLARRARSARKTSSPRRWAAMRTTSSRRRGAAWRCSAAPMLHTRDHRAADSLHSCAGRRTLSIRTPGTRWIITRPPSTTMKSRLVACSRVVVSLGEVGVHRARAARDDRDAANLSTDGRSSGAERVLGRGYASTRFSRFAITSAIACRRSGARARPRSPWRGSSRGARGQGKITSSSM